MVKLAGTFGKFQPFKVLVLGDFMLDTYTSGRVKRISPEAPVPVMEILKEESRAGGAGNVVLNLLALGGLVFAVGRVGDDLEGKKLKDALNFPGVDLSTLLVENGYKTPVKNRLIADSQQLLRVDLEKITPIQEELEDEVLQRLEVLIPQMQIVAFSDYGKGFLSTRIIQKTIEMAQRAKVPTIVDPKGLDFTKYRGSTVLKPNMWEAYAAAKKNHSQPLSEVADSIFEQVDVELLLITRSEAGMSLFSKDKTIQNFPVRSKEVKDVTGAGDTVLAMLCLGLANGLEMETSVELANIAAGLAIERLGCVQITLAELAERLLKTSSDTKIFDENHTFALHKVLEGRSYTLLVLEKENEMTSDLFQAIRNLSNREGQELVIYVKDCHPNDDFIHLLSSLQEIDYIIIQTESLKNLLHAIHPRQIYIYKDKMPVFEKNLVLSSLLDHLSIAK